jgi:hypothetical protein
MTSASIINGRFDYLAVIRELRKAVAVDGWAVVREPEEMAVLRDELF